MKNLIITTDKNMAMIADMAMVGEEHLARHNGQIDLDDDDAIDAMIVSGIF